MIAQGVAVYIYVQGIWQTLLSKRNLQSNICRQKVKQCQALTISRLTHSPYTTKIDRIGCTTEYYSMIEYD